ncbi:zinc finger, CCHC-type containing protein [Tanacetum coccineum]
MIFDFSYREFISNGHNIINDGHNIIYHISLVPNLDVSQDRVQWRDHNGNMAGFSVKLAWEALRPTGLEVLWFSTIWFPYGIPRHAFHLWLVMWRSLKTQDMLRPWDVEPNTDLSMLRLFKDTRRPPEEIRDLIMVTVRLKLISFRFKNTPRVQRLLALWKMPSNFRLYGDPVNTSLHTIDHEIETRNEKERVVLERETKERLERKMREKRNGMI